MTTKYNKIKKLLNHAKKLKRLGGLKKHEEYKHLVELTNFLPNDISVSRRLWHINNNIFNIPKCLMCENDAIWNKEKGGSYRETCSLFCSGKNPNRMKKIHETNLKKYGSESPFGSKKVQEKSKQTIQKKYNINNVSELNWVKQKKIETSLLNYNVEHPLQSPLVKEKMKQTNMERYSHENTFQVEEFKEKAKQTMLKNHGVEHALQNKEIQERMKQTNIERYNAKHTWCSGTSSRLKQQNTMLEKYGTISINPLSTKVLQMLNDKDWLYNQHHIKKKTMVKIGNELSISPATVCNYLHKYNINIITRPTSEPEREIVKFIESLITTKILTSSRKIIPPYELDIYIPEYNIAIEYNGLYWHSEINGKYEKYHLMKTEMCEAKNIRLIHIFEDEWQDQQQKCKDTIRHLLGVSPKGVYARNTIIKEIPWKQAKDFLNQYHLLNAGSCGNYRIGAFDKDDNLIGVMVFGNTNNENSGKNNIELKRFVTNKKNNPGLGSKMFKYAIVQKNYQEIIAFVDRRWFTGLVKSYIGFKIVNITPPAIWWTDTNNRYHRRFITKKKLIENGFPSNISKRKILEAKGYSRIWDCGKIKLLWENTIS